MAVLQGETLNVRRRRSEYLRANGGQSGPDGRPRWGASKRCSHRISGRDPRQHCVTSNDMRIVPPRTRRAVLAGTIASAAFVATSAARGTGARTAKFGETSMTRTAATLAANGISIAYQAFGPPQGEVVLIIAGVGGMLSDDGNPLAEAIAERGFRVIVYDGRDSGGSTNHDAAGPPNWPAIQAALAAGQPPPLAYSLTDLAADAIGLLDALGVAKAHIVGGSMGGMIAQLIAIEWPERVLSLTSMMSTTGNPDLPAGRAMEIVGAPPPVEGGFDALVEHRVRMMQAMGSPAYPTDIAVLRRRAAAELRTPNLAERTARQGAAAALGGDRRPRLRSITAPTVVLHGDSDPMFTVEHGRDTAAWIPHAELRVIPGLGHDVPETLLGTFVDAIAAAAARSRASR